MQFLKSYCIHKTFDLGLYWKFKKVTKRSTSNLAEILMGRTSLPVKLQDDADTFCSIIIFTRSCKMLPFERSTSNSSEILMWIIGLYNYNMIHAIAEELTRSQGNLTLSNFESSKKSHKGQHQTSLRFWCAEYYYQVTTWYRQFMKSYYILKVLLDVACLKVYKGHTKVNIKLGWNSDQ